MEEKEENQTKVKEVTRESMGHVARELLGKSWFLRKGHLGVGVEGVVVVFVVAQEPLGFLVLVSPLVFPKTQSFSPFVVPPLLPIEKKRGSCKGWELGLRLDFGGESLLFSTFSTNSGR